AAYLAAAGERELRDKLSGFVHRFTDEDAIVAFLGCIGGILKRGGTLEDMFLSHYSGDTWSAAEGFASELMACGGQDDMFLLPRPSKGSACKRLVLYLRWMVRRDEVDPGGWRKITPDALFIPLDTHMFQICSNLGLCTRHSADGKAAREITENFRIVRPDDPARYDFSMTRFGIRSEMTHEQLFAKWSEENLIR
ncbi:MAG: TIGR02757 family protein, partial [Synergistaceae bacterium]|nr:TIGR02757 family protein [Synergistaceae bacterium]